MCDLPKSLREDELTIGLYAGMGIYEQVLPQGAWSVKGRLACEVTLMIGSQRKMVVPGGLFLAVNGGNFDPRTSRREASFRDLPGTK